MIDRRSSPVPAADPGAAYRHRKAAIDEAIQRVLASGRYILGPEVEAFEEELAAWLGCEHAVGVANGTDALELALRAAGSAPGRLVYTVSHTAVATVAAIELAGATPVLLDIDPATFSLDPARLDEALADAGRWRDQGRPWAVVAVHLYGHPAPLADVLEVARRHGLIVFEDCAQSHGAAWAGRTTGTWGVAGSFSFYPTKNLGALGDGGAVVTSDDRLARRVRELRQYGWRERQVSAEPGLNSRLDELQAAVLRVKLDHLAEDNARRRELARLYAEELEGVEPPRVAAEAEHVYHQYVIRCERRDELKTWLAEQSIGTAIHYPVPVHLQPAYAGRLRLPHGGLEATERACREVLSLPIHPELGDAEVRRVARAIRAWHRPESHVRRL